MILLNIFQRKPKPKVLLPEFKEPDFAGWQINISEEVFLKELKTYYFYELNKTAMAVAKGTKEKDSLVATAAKLELIEKLLQK